MELIAYNAHRYPAYRLSARSLYLNLARPLFEDSLDEISRSAKEKLRQSDLHKFVLQDHADVGRALSSLRDLLTLPDIQSSINATDSYGSTPLDYATSAFPEAVEVLLEAGASLKTGTFLLHQCEPDQWKPISALIRAGYPVDEVDEENSSRSPLHDAPTNYRVCYRQTLELVRHGGHLLDWDARDEGGHTPLQIAEYYAKENPNDEQHQLIRELYRAQKIPPHAQYISSFDGERLMSVQEAATHPRLSLIDVGLAGDVAQIGALIAAGAMINERDDKGRTLLHLIAMGDRVPNGYRVVVELERHGGYGIDHNALFHGKTALDIADRTLRRTRLTEMEREEMEQIIDYLESRWLPAGEAYVFPCMDRNFCRDCGSLGCICPENDVPGMPGSFC